MKSTSAVEMSIHAVSPLEISTSCALRTSGATRRRSKGSASGSIAPTRPSRVMYAMESSSGTLKARRGRPAADLRVGGKARTVLNKPAQAPRKDHRDLDLAKSRAGIAAEQQPTISYGSYDGPTKLYGPTVRLRTAARRGSAPDRSRTSAAYSR